MPGNINWTLFEPLQQNSKAFEKAVFSLKANVPQ
jgi:hypothetical protein